MFFFAASDVLKDAKRMSQRETYQASFHDMLEL